MKENFCPDYSFVSEVYIYHDKHKTMAIVAVWPNVDDSFLSCECTGAYLDDVNDKRMLGRS
jgi:hypothetical protein